MAPVVAVVAVAPGVARVAGAVAPVVAVVRGAVASAAAVSDRKTGVQPVRAAPRES